MKQKLITALWIVGYSFLGLWTCFLIWLVIDTREITFGLFLRIAVGVFVLWHLFARLKDRWKSSATRN